MCALSGTRGRTPRRGMLTSGVRVLVSARFAGSSVNGVTVAPYHEIDIDTSEEANFLPTGWSWGDGAA